MNLENKNIVITGTLRQYTREKAFILIIEKNGKPKTNMNNTIDILVISDEKQNKSTMKIEKAKQNKHLTIINESQFYDLLKS